MKFLADMGISPATVAALRANGYEAFHLMERGLERLPDTEVLQLARAESCVLLTHDLDFGELVAAAGSRLPSVITFRLSSMRPEVVTAYLLQLLHDHQALLEEGAFVSVNDRMVRVRTLPMSIRAH